MKQLKNNIVFSLIYLDVNKSYIVLSISSIMESFSFGTRAIVEQGSSLTMSLPKGWARAVGLKPGDKVRVVMDKDFNLKLMPGSIKPVMLLAFGCAFLSSVVVGSIKLLFVV